MAPIVFTAVKWKDAKLFSSKKARAYFTESPVSECTAMINLVDSDQKRITSGHELYKEIRIAENG